MGKGPPYWKIRLAAAVVVTLLALGLLEGGARLAFSYKDPLKDLLGFKPNLVLDGYEMPDPKRPDHWALRPSTEWTLRKLIAEKAAQGAVLGEQRLREMAARYGNLDQVMFRINRHGFKGPEIDPDHRHPRILTIGDSCTFGTLHDASSYPRELERALAAAGHPVEVINGGVEGYAPKNVLARMDEYLALEPDLVTLYIGWNAIYSASTGDALKDGLATIALARKAWIRISTMIKGEGGAAFDAYRREKHPDPNAPILDRLKHHDLPFVEQVERIVDGFVAQGVPVMLLTLPGLYGTESAPGTDALEKGHLPPYTDNPYVVAALAERYNAQLRALAMRRRAGLVDLAAWSRDALVPRETYFSDAVHLEEHGQRMIGRYLAEQLIATWQLES